MTTFDQLVKIEMSTKSDNYDDYDNYDDFPGAYANILEKKSIDKSYTQEEIDGFDEGIRAKTTDTVEFLNRKILKKMGTHSKSRQSCQNCQNRH